jgi:murein DD-endopeptidase MepM/ murein hydrolase activator NlpD
MTEKFPVGSKNTRESAGFPRFLAIPTALTVAMAVTFGGSVAAVADDSEPPSSTASATSNEPAESTDTASDPESTRLRDLAAAAIEAVKASRDDGGTADTDAEAETAADEPTTEPTTAPTTEPTPEPTEPPADETPPPAEETPPPSEETPPPSEETPPPAEETPPPTEETPPPAEETPPPAEETPAPTEPTDPPTGPTEPPASQNPPAPEPDPIPVRPRPSVRPTPNSAAAADAAAKAAAARAVAAERAEAIAAAQETFATARVAYDDAKREFASATAERDAAQARADLIHTMATDAAKAASRSERILGALVRSLAQQGSGSAAAGVLLDSRGGASILYQLGTLEKLSELSGNVEVIRERAEADQVRAESLAAQDVAAQQLVLSIPVDAAKAAVDSAKAQFDAASAALASLRTSAPVGLIGLTPLSELLAADTGQLSDQGWAHPAIGRITDIFGPRPERPVPGVNEFHHGTDIGAACNAGIYAATSGVVVAAGTLGTYGNWILIDHGDGIETGYAHLAEGETLVGVGEPVIAGQVIGGVGSTGASTGCHLHFEVRIDGTRVDAQSFMAERGIELGAE